MIPFSKIHDSPPPTPHTMPVQAFDSRRLVGVHAERVSDVSSRDFPGHYPGEDHSWNLSIFKKVREVLYVINDGGVFFFFLWKCRT
jgi:hypothetical protein